MRQIISLETQKQDVPLEAYSISACKCPSVGRIFFALWIAVLKQATQARLNVCSKMNCIDFGYRCLERQRPL